MARRKGNKSSFLLIIISLLACFVAIAGITYLSTHSFSDIISSVNSQSTNNNEQVSDDGDSDIDYVRAPKDVYL